jgi:UDP-glucose 4-epimerase
MKILVIGGAGYIGSHFAATALEEMAGVEISIIDDLSTGSRGAIQAVEVIAKKSVPFYEVDILDLESVQKTFQTIQPDCVVHFAAKKSPAESIRLPLDYYSNNIIGSINILKSMQLVNCKKLVFSSSAAVYGNPEYLPVDENHTRAPLSPYGFSKKAIEDTLENFCSVTPDFSVMALRYFNPVGCHDSNLLGERVHDKAGNLVPAIMQSIFSSSSPVSVFGDDYETEDGTGVRDFIHVMDLVSGHLAALKTMQTQTGYRAYNLGTGQGKSVLECIHLAQTLVQKEIAVEVHPRRDGDISVSYASVALAKEELSWESSFGLEEMLASSIEWWQSQLFDVES